MSLPILLSIPHAGLLIPKVVKDLCILNLEDIIKDSDGRASEIYHPLYKEVSAFVTTDVARAIIDVNRAESDRRKDGVVKTHTCWNVPVYNEFPSGKLVEYLLEEYYRPYHRRLTLYAKDILLGVDCHTMAATGPPVGPDPDVERSYICITNADSTCPTKWLSSLAASFEKIFETKVSINKPFKGGYIIRHHSQEIPWIQLELSRAPFLSNEEKSSRVFDALKSWFKNNSYLLKKKSYGRRGRIEKNPIK